MKSLYPYILLALFLVVGCGKEWTPSNSRQVTVILDMSNRHLMQTVAEDIPEILNALCLENDKWEAVDFRLVIISSVAYNRAQELHLPAEDPDEGNILVRKRRVKDFKARAEDLLRFHAAQPRDEDASLVYLPVALELERLAQCSACSREIIIYSDLIEHHGKGQWSLYSAALLDSLQRSPQSFVNHFARQRELPTLSGITCTVVNIPRNTPNSSRVSVIFNFYERMLESKGAIVNIAGNYISGTR